MVERNPSRLQMLLQLLKTGLSRAKDFGIPILKGKRWDWWTYYSPEDEHRARLRNYHLQKLRRKRGRR